MKKIKMLKVNREGFMKEEGKFEVIEVEQTLEELQKLVGGLIEYVPVKISGIKGVEALINEEGKVMNMKPTVMMIHEGEIYDALVGDVYITKYGTKGNVSLTDDEIEKIISEFKNNPVCLARDLSHELVTLEY